MADIQLVSALPELSKPTADEAVARLVRDSLTENSRRAYLSDLAHFESWGGQVPATDQLIASYLAAHAETASTATLQRRVASLSKAHRALGLANPTQSELVKAVLRGIKRSGGRPQKQAKALLRDDLLAVLDAIGGDLKISDYPCLVYVLVYAAHTDLALRSHQAVAPASRSSTSHDWATEKRAALDGRAAHVIAVVEGRTTTPNVVTLVRAG
jgi:hypothetical protein